MNAWRWPAILAAVTLCGLAAALLGQGGLWWWLSWVLLALPPAACLTPLFLRRRVRQS